MRTSYDVLRSLKRFGSVILGDDYEIHEAGDEGATARPMMMVKPTATATISGPRHTMEYTQPFALYAYPEPGETPYESLHVASTVEEGLITAFRIGGIGEGHPGRVPLYDYDSVGADEGSDARNEPDYARLLDFNIERMQSVEDELLWTVTAEVRLGWYRSALLLSGERTAQEVRIEIDES
jgi:hypothetical protein